MSGRGALRLAANSHYPGPWANWISGWITQRAIMKQDFEEARAELYDFMTPALKVKGP